MRPFLTPRWLGRHALLLVSVAVLGWVGAWQWDKASDGSGSWQNYGYAAQWWLFAGFAVFLWVKAVLDELDPSRLQPPPPVQPLQQPKAPPPADDEDDELAAYNRYLASLDQSGGGQ